MPPVSFIPAAILMPVSLTPVANLPSVSLIPVVHLDLQISPRIFEQNLKTVLMEYSGAGGKLIHEKKPEAKKLVTLSPEEEVMPRDTNYETGDAVWLAAQLSGRWEQRN
jgi:hypothetical protein